MATSLSMYEASVPVFAQYLEALSETLVKTGQQAQARRVDPAVYCQLRLFPDMLPLARQVQIAADFAKNAASRLAGQEPPRFADDETTFEELEARIARTLVHIRSVPAAAIDAGADRTVSFTADKQTLQFTGRVYLLHFALPNFVFHVTAAYSILRANGVDLTKRDFIGTLPA